MRECHAGSRQKKKKKKKKESEIKAKSTLMRESSACILSTNVFDRELAVNPDLEKLEGPTYPNHVIKDAGTKIFSWRTSDQKIGGRGRGAGLGIPFSSPPTSNLSKTPKQNG